MTRGTHRCNTCHRSRVLLYFEPDMPNKCLTCRVAYAEHEVKDLQRRIREMPARRRTWTDQELSILLQVMIFEDGDISKVAQLVGRTNDVCRAKFDLLGLPRERKISTRKHTDEEIAKVYYCMYVRGLSTYITAHVMGYKSHNVVIGINHRDIKPDPQRWVGQWSPPSDFVWPSLTTKQRSGILFGKPRQSLSTKKEDA